MDRETVAYGFIGVTKSQTRPKQVSTRACITDEYEICETVGLTYEMIVKLFP